MNLIEVAGELITLSVMAFALGMDAFSVGLGMGMIPLRLKQIFYIGMTIGIFHIMMPLAGIGVGKFLSSHLGNVATYAGGSLLIILGGQMIFSSFKQEERTIVAPVGYGLLMFALSVSLDSFSVGLSLGIYGARTLVTILLFGLFSTILTWSGLLLGRKVQKWFGSYGEALGGSILLAFGMKLLLPL